MTVDEALNRIRIAELPDFDGRSVDSVWSVGAFGDMPLHVASIWGDAEMLVALIDAGAPVDAPGEQNMTPLHYAIEHGHIDCIRLLIVAGSSLTATERLGLTPSELALLSPHPEVRRMFKKKKMKTEPNKAVEPTPVAVTNRAIPPFGRARFAPATSVAHL